MSAPASRTLRLGLLLAGLGLITASACTGVTPGAAPTPGNTANAGESSAGSAEPSASDTASPDPDASPSETPDGSAAPGDEGAGTPTPSPTSTEPVTCNTVTPARLGRTTVDARRTTEVATVVSDGRNLTPGTSERTEFLTPQLIGPLGTRIDDAPTMQQVAKLIEDSSKNRILLERPEAPDADAEASRRPFDAPGTYALYNASSPVTVDVVVVCAGQEQRWTFTGEGNPSDGLVNCAVEPSRSNIVARLVYQSAC